LVDGGHAIRFRSSIEPLQSQTEANEENDEFSA